MVKGEERTSPTAWLLPGILCCLLALVGVAMAIGSVVPAVGDAMGVESRGVGGMFGFLAGALFFGGLGLVGLWAWHRERKRGSTPRSGTAAELAAPTPTTPLPDGPGLAARWWVAVPLMLFTTLVPVLGQVTVAAWTRVAFRESLPILGELTFGEAFREALGNIAYVVTIPVFVLLVFLVRRTMFAAWPKACLWLAVLALGPSTLVVAAYNSGSVLPNLALGAGLIWMNYEVGKLTLWRLSRPIALDLVPSELEVPYRVPDSPARLRVRRDRVMLDRLGSERVKVRKEILWAELSEARLEHVGTATVWQATTSTSIKVPPGPALRLKGAGEDWLLPIEEPLGEDIATLITLRASRHR